MKVAIIDGLVVVILFCVVVRAEMATHELQCDGQDNCVIGSKTVRDFLPLSVSLPKNFAHGP